MSWGIDGIVFVVSDGIMRVSPLGGPPEMLVKIEGNNPNYPGAGNQQAAGPQVLPDGNHVLFTLAIGRASERRQTQIVVQSRTSGERKTLISNAVAGQYVPTGHIVYAVGGVLYVVAFDLQRLEQRLGSVCLSLIGEFGRHHADSVRTPRRARHRFLRALHRFCMLVPTRVK
jgi:hypothetical protein